MSRTEDIANAIWNEPDFFDLTSNGKLLYLWSWTNTRCHWSGIYQVPLAAISLETKLTEDEVTSALAELHEAEFLFYDGRYLWCKARVKRLKTRTVQMCKAVAKDLHNVPEEHPYRRQLLELQGSRVWQSGDTRTTIREQLGYLTGDTPDPHPTHTPLTGPSQKNPSHGRATSVAPMTGTGTGTGSSRRRAVGRAREAAPAYKPDPEMVALRDEYFPSYEVTAIEGAATRLRWRNQDVTVEAIRALIGDVSDYPVNPEAA